MGVQGAVGFAYIIAKRVRKAGVLTSVIRDGARARVRGSHNEGSSSRTAP